MWCGRCWPRPGLAVRRRRGPGRGHRQPEAAHRLALWSRRLLGEAITQAQFVLADHDELVDLVVSGGDGLAQLTEFFDRLQRTHTTRMQELGLA